MYDLCREKEKQAGHIKISALLVSLLLTHRDLRNVAFTPLKGRRKDSLGFEKELCHSDL